MTYPKGLINELLKDLTVTSTVPSDTPKNAVAMRIYDNGSARRLYIYFKGGWHDAGLDLDLSDYPTTEEMTEAISNAVAGLESASNKSNNSSLGSSATLYPTQKAVKDYVDLKNPAFSPSEDLLKKTQTASISKTSSTPVKFISINNPVSGGLRIKVQASIGYSETGYIAVYKNGAQVGATHILNSGGNYTYITEDIYGWAPGDTIEIWGYSSGGTLAITLGIGDSSFASNSIFAVYGAQYSWSYNTY